MVALLVIGIIVVVGSILISSGKDKQSLEGKTVTEKFKTIIQEINKVGFDGNANIHYYNDKHISMVHENSGNQFVDILYSQGVLLIEWKYKYLQKELVYKRNFSNVRNLSIIEQSRIAESLILGMNEAVQDHQNQVLNS